MAEFTFVKSRTFGIFWICLLLNTVPGGWVWSMRIILWEASYFRHSNNIHPAKASLQKLLMELKQKWKLQVLFRKRRATMNVFSCFTIRRSHWLWFCAPVFLTCRKVGRVEVNLFSPAYPSVITLSKCISEFTACFKKWRGLIKFYKLASRNFFELKVIWKKVRLCWLIYLS